MIQNDDLRLRAPEREHLPLFTTWVNDPDVTEYLSMYLPMSSLDEEDWFEGMRKRPKEEQPLTIEVREGEGAWRPIGNCGLFNIDWKNRSAEIGIMIGEKDVWNRGYGTRAMRMLLQHGFETLNLHRLFLRVFEPNRRAIRAYETAGFVHEGRQREAEYKGGRYMDVLFMSVLKWEWEAAKNSAPAQPGSA